KMANVTGSSGQAPAVAPPVRTDKEIVPRNMWVQIRKRPLLLPPPYHQYTSNNFRTQYNMTRKLKATGVNWMNSGSFGASRAPGASGSSQVPPPPPHPPSSTIQEKERPATPEPAWLISSSDAPVPPNNWASAMVSSYSPPYKDSLLAQTSDIATFIDWFYLEYLRYGSKGKRLVLSILKMKATYYPDAGLEQMVPDQFWIEEECKYDIAAMYGVSHLWFQRQQFYLNRQTSKGDRGAVRTHIRILSVVRIKVFSLYGYDYMKKIVLRRADLNEHVIAERDFKYLYPSDFEDLYLLKLQGFEYKHDSTVIDSPRAVMFRDKYEVQMMMRFNEIHKFSDGTLQQIDEALDYRVKEFRINRMNPGSKDFSTYGRAYT
nr:hypothetical protein [Tanacetum cinerariifolium]